MPFVKGQSGNPAGRPRGCRNKVNREFDAELAQEGKYVARDLIGFLRQGNPTAMRLIAQRMMPVSRGRPVDLALPDLNSPADRPAAVAEIKQALSDGEITIEEASDLLTWVDEALGLGRKEATAVEVQGLTKEVTSLRASVAILNARLDRLLIDKINAESMIGAAAQLSYEATTEDAMPQEEAAEAAPVIARINAESTNHAGLAAPAPMTTEPSPHQHEPVNIRQRTGLGYDPMAAVVVATSGESE